MAYDNPIIKKRFEEKMKRLDKTSLSILISWAINNAVNSLPEETKKKWGAVKNKIEERYPYFIDLYRSWMLENMPIEPVKLGREDFMEAKAEAPAEQAKQEVANEIPPDDTNFGDEAVTTLPTEEIE